MDPIDRQIVATLVKDARTPFLRIAKDIGVTEGAIRHRVKKLKKQGIIRAFTADVLQQTNIILLIETNQEISKKSIISELHEQGAKCYDVSGKYEIVCFTDMEKVERIKAIKGISYCDFLKLNFP